VAAPRYGDGDCERAHVVVGVVIVGRQGRAAEGVIRVAGGLEETREGRV